MGLDRAPLVRRAAAFARTAGPVLCCAGTLLLAGCENLQIPQIGPALTDEQPLSNAVRDALGANPETMHQQIDVKTLDVDLVRLSGSVDTEATRQTAEAIAQAVPGVRSVVNTMFIRY